MYICYNITKKEGHPFGYLPPSFRIRISGRHPVLATISFGRPIGRTTSDIVLDVLIDVLSDVYLENIFFLTNKNIVLHK